MNKRVGSGINKLLRGGRTKTFDIWHQNHWNWQNRKNVTKTKFCGNQQKLWRITEKMFLIKFLTKIDFWERILLFQSHPSPKNIKILAVNNTATSQWSKFQKPTDLFCNFLVPVGTIWHDPSIELDLSCSEHFFWRPGGSDSAPNSLISIFPFSSFFEFLTFWIFHDFHSISIFLINFLAFLIFGLG